MKALILGLWFAAPFSALFLWLTFFRGFMSWSGGAFDRFGHSWIWLKCGCYGLAGLLVGLAFTLTLTKDPMSGLLFLVSLALVILDFVPRDEVWNYSYVDHAIDYVGYVISRLNPCVPHDAATPHGHLPVFAPTTHITVETPKGRLGIISGHGLLRTYEWEGVARSLELIALSNGTVRRQFLP